MLDSRSLPRSSAPWGLNVVPKEAWLFCRTSSGVRLCWELEEPKGPKGSGLIERDSAGGVVVVLVHAKIQLRGKDEDLTSADVRREIKERDSERETIGYEPFERERDRWTLDAGTL